MMSGDRCRCKSTDVASRSAEEFVRCHTRLRVRTLAGEKNNFCDAQTHISKERCSSARRGCEYGNCNGVRFRRERRSSARRGSGKRTGQGPLAKSRETTGGELTNAGAVAVAKPRGANAPAPDVPYDVGPRTWPRSPSLLRPKPRGLTPPALVLRCEHLSAKRQHAPC